jgi:hypothetical protein
LKKKDGGARFLGLKLLKLKMTRDDCVGGGGAFLCPSVYITLALKFYSD